MAYMVTSFEPMDVARTVLRERWMGEGARQRLWTWGEGFLEWYGGVRWRYLDQEAMRRELWRVLDDVSCETETKTGSKTEYFCPNRDKVANVLEALKSLCEMPSENLPRWVGECPAEDVRQLVAFEDAIVDVGATARGFRETGRYEWVTYPVTEAFVTTVGARCKWNPEAPSEKWDEFQRQWSGGDKVKLELSDRFYGYLWLGHRRYSRLLVEWGKVRSGKGTKHRLLKKLMGGFPTFCGTLADELANPFGLDNPSKAHVLVVDEIGDTRGMVGKRLATIAKSAVGHSEVQVNRKGLQMLNMALKCGVIFVGHDLIALPNEQRGVTSKMLPVHYAESFLGRENFNLDEELWEEREGVMRRWMEAAVRLEAELDPAKKFVVGEDGRALVERFEAAANPWDAFLQKYFVMSPGSRVAFDLVKPLRVLWEREECMALKNDRGVRVADHKLGQHLVEKSSWGLKVARSTGGRVVLEGMALRAGVVIRPEVVAPESDPSE